MRNTPEEILKKHLLEEGHTEASLKWLNPSILKANIAAMQEYKLQTRRYNLLRLPFRLMVFPFILTSLLIGLIRQLLVYIFDYIAYGGEILAYNNKNSPKMITEVYDKLEDLLKIK